VRDAKMMAETIAMLCEKDFSNSLKRVIGSVVVLLLTSGNVKMPQEYASRLAILVSDIVFLG